MADILTFDEVNRLAAHSVNTALEGVGKSPKEIADEIIDDILSLLILGWLDGEKLAAEDLKTAVQEYSEAEFTDMMNAAIYKRIDGKDFSQRVEDYVEEYFASEGTDGGGLPPKIQRIAETEYHRLFNEGGESFAKRYRDDTGASVTKTWGTMRDPKVRETHEYLEGETVPLDELFYTFDGDSAMYPGGFTLPENNINCRCVIRYAVESYAEGTATTNAQ